MGTRRRARERRGMTEAEEKGEKRKPLNGGCFAVDIFSDDTMLNYHNMATTKPLPQ